MPSPHLPGAGFEALSAPFGVRARAWSIEDLVKGDRVDGDLAAHLAQTVSEHGLVVFEGAALDTARLAALARCLGDPIAPEIPHEIGLADPTHREVVELSNVRPDGQLVHIDDTQAVLLRGFERWHTDGSYQAAPPTFTVLAAVDLPRRGGQTQFADMRAALRVLPPEQRSEMAELALVHSYEHWRANHPGRLPQPGDDESSRFAPVEHLWIRTLDDGTQALYMGAFASHVVGMPEADGRQWLAEVEAQLSVHDLVYEHQWRPGDVVVFDSRTTLYRSLRYDIANERRVLRRVMVQTAGIR